MREKGLAGDATEREPLALAVEILGADAGAAEAQVVNDGSTASPRGPIVAVAATIAQRRRIVVVAAGTYEGQGCCAKGCFNGRCESGRVFVYPEIDGSKIYETLVFIVF